MTDEQKTFLELAVIRQLPYDQIAEKTGIPREKFTLWWEELKEEKEKLSKIRQIWSKKCSKIDFWVFYNWYNVAVKKCFYL